MNGKHHYLPQFYLKGFCNSEQKLHTYNKKYSNYKEFSPAQVYYEKGLNDVIIKDHYVADLENDIFQDIDNEFSNGFNKVLQKYNKDTESLSLKDKKVVVEFVLNLYWRLPSSNNALIELLDKEGLLGFGLKLINRDTRQNYVDDDIPNIIADIKRCDHTKKIFKPILDYDNRTKYDWEKLENNFNLIETNIPLIIGDVPFVALKSENKRGKILEEFMFPFTANKVLIYAENTPCFLETNLIRYFSFCIFENSEEKVSCSDIKHLKSVINYILMAKEKQKLYPKIISSGDYLSKLLDFQAGFSCLKEFEEYYIQNKANFGSYL